MEGAAPPAPGGRRAAAPLRTDPLALRVGQQRRDGRVDDGLHVGVLDGVVGAIELRAGAGRWGNGRVRWRLAPRSVPVPRPVPRLPLTYCTGVLSHPTSSCVWGTRCTLILPSTRLDALHVRGRVERGSRGTRAYFGHARCAVRPRQPMRQARPWASADPLPRAGRARGCLLTTPLQPSLAAHRGPLAVRTWRRPPAGRLPPRQRASFCNLARVLARGYVRLR